MNVHGYLHNMCRACYRKEWPGADPKLIYDTDEWCCFCGRKTDQWTVTRATADPQQTPQCPDLEIA